MLMPDEELTSSPRLLNRVAFALVELLVILILMLILLGLLVPALYSAQLAAGRREAMNKLRQLGLAVHGTQSVYQKLPPAFDKYAQVTFPTSVHVYLLPFLEEDPAYKAIVMEKGKGEAANPMIPFFLAPDDPSNARRDLKGIQNFAANLRVFAAKGVQTRYDADMPALGEIEPGNAVIPKTFRDGTSNTILFTTKYGYCGKGGSRYMSPPKTAFAAFFGQNAARTKAHAADKAATFQLRPTAKECCTNPLIPQSFYRTITLVGMADGTAMQLSAQVSQGTWNCATHPNDGQALGADWSD